MPGSGDAKHPMVDAQKDTGAFVEALTKVSPGKTLKGYGTSISWNDWLKLWGKFHGVQASYKEVSVQDWDKLLPGGLGRELGEMMAYSAEIGYYGKEPDMVDVHEVIVLS